jgi:hypothetical protein
MATTFWLALVKSMDDHRHHRRCGGGHRELYVKPHHKRCDSQAPTQGLRIVAPTIVAPPQAFSQAPRVALARAMIAHRWWHGYTTYARGVMSHSIGRGVFALILVGGSFMDLPITHEALLRWVMTLIIRVKTSRR